MTDSTPIILVDGSSYLYRAYHVMRAQESAGKPPLTNPDGEPTGAMHVVLNMLRSLRKEYQPAQMAVVFDAKGKTFRHEIYADYKANRPPMPEDLRMQIEPLHEIIKAQGYPMPMIAGVEADDVIGTLTQAATERGDKVLVSTGDKDMAQLVNEHITLINTMTNIILDREGVIKKFGVPPERIIDYLALVGDTSDNVPGVPKCGPKTAVKWLTEFGSLDDIIANADQVKGKVGENLRASLEQLSLARELVTIKLDVALDFAADDLAIQAQDFEKLKQLYSQQGFKTWLKEFDAESNDKPPAEKPAANYATILDKKSFNAWLKQLKQSELFAFDTETTSLQYAEAEVVGLSFSTEPGKAAYVPLAHDYPGAPEQLKREWVLQELKSTLENPKQNKVGQNLKYDKSVLANHGINLQGIQHDTMLESYVLDATGSRHDMDTLAEKYLGLQTIHFEDIAGKGAKQITFNQIAIEDASPYAAEDADITLRLHQTLWPELEKHDGQRKVYQTIEMPLLPVLSRVEMNGVLLDQKMLKKQTAELAARMVDVERDAHEEAGQPFNLSSPKQIQEILFGKLGLTPTRKTPKGQPSTAEDAMQELTHQHALPGMILEYRMLSKLKSTYTEKLPGMVSAKTGRLHTSYRQAVASTGRLSSNDPNLQNIPIRTAEGRRVRKAFIAPKGYQLIAADYSQIELRIMAHLSKDRGLLDAFAAGEDIHRATAGEVFGAKPQDVSNDQRRAAKAINFGLIYGMSAFGLGRQLGIGRNEAQEYVDLYFARYPGVKEYMDKTRAQAHEDEFVETYFGRRLYLPTINAKNGQHRAAAERTAINAPMQGTAADIIKLAMIHVDRWLSESGVDAKMIMQVHDELVLEAAEPVVEEVKAKVTELMMAAADLKVPLVVDTGVGNNWDEAH